MNIRDFNKLLVVILTGILIIYILTSSLETDCFKPLELLAAYFILMYDMSWGVYDLVTR